MKNFLTALVVAATVCTSVAATAQPAYPRSGYASPSYTRPYVADPLHGTTMMRVHNDSDYPIVAIRSSNMQYPTYRWGSPLTWAGGIIPPHSTVTVDFGDHTRACLFNVEMRTVDGHVHMFGGINTCTTNDIVVPNNGWATSGW